MKIREILPVVIERERWQFKETLRKICDERIDIEDVIQDACLKLLKWDGEVETDKHMCHLFTVTIKQLVANFYHRLEIRNRIENSVYEEVDDIDLPHSTVEYYPASEIVTKRIRRLTKTQQNVIIGTFFEGLEWREIGEKYGIKHTSVPSTKKQALAHLSKTVMVHKSSNDYVG